MTLNIENEAELKRYLNSKGYVRQQEKLQVKILRGGVSNRAVWLQRENGSSWVLKQALEKLRVQVDWFSHPRRIRQEALALEWFAKFCPKGSVPQLIFFDSSEHLLAMKAVATPHENYKTQLLNEIIHLSYFEQLGSLLGSIHTQAEQNLRAVSTAFAEYSFFESLRLEPYYEYTAEQLPTASTFLHQLCHACRSHRYTLVHGDYSPKNILIHEDRLVLLDYEVAHYGDGTFDVGFVMTHLLSKAHHVANARSLLIKGAELFWQAYSTLVADKWDADKESRAVDHTLACLLARVHGRSPLEYLNEQEKKLQTKIALELIENRPHRMPELIERFESNLSDAQNTIR